MSLAKIINLHRTVPVLSVRSLQKLREWGYAVREEGREVTIEFQSPTLGEAASSPEAGGERRTVSIRGVREGDVVRLVEAYVEGGGERRRIDIGDLELWIAYVESA